MAPWVVTSVLSPASFWFCLSLCSTPPFWDLTQIHKTRKWACLSHPLVLKELQMDCPTFRLQNANPGHGPRPARNFWNPIHSTQAAQRGHPFAFPGTSLRCPGPGPLESLSECFLRGCILSYQPGSITLSLEKKPVHSFSTYWAFRL